MHPGHYPGAVAPPNWQQYRPGSRRRAETGRDADAADVRPSVTPYEPPADLPYVRTVEERTVRRGPTTPATGVLVLVAMVAMIVVGVVISRSGDEQVARDEAASPVPGPQSAVGFDTMLTAMREEGIGTTAYEVALYDDYAVLTVPAPVGGEAADVYQWDGTGFAEWNKTTSRETPYDLASLDGTRLAEMCDYAQGLLARPEQCYLLVTRPKPDDSTQDWLTAYASDEYGQSAVVRYDLAGAVLDELRPSAAPS